MHKNLFIKYIKYNVTNFIYLLIYKKISERIRVKILFYFFINLYIPNI